MERSDFFGSSATYCSAYSLMLSIASVKKSTFYSLDSLFYGVVLVLVNLFFGVSDSNTLILMSLLGFVYSFSLAMDIAFFGITG